MKRLLILLLAAVVAAPLFSAFSMSERAAAANAALWNPGYIISDSKFYDGGAMRAADVQSFLQGRISSCAAGYTCLKDYRQSTPSIAPTALCPGGYAGSPDERASDIIAKVGAACNISQAVLLVLLEKEQSLVSSRSPSARAYTAATGFGCPDTAPCDPAYAGFFYQVYNAARQFQNYAANPTSWNYQAGRLNNILYHPDAARCGRAPVYIQNKATAALYIYTPYQPNPAALANLYGSGDACSSYGNRNFWRIYSDWFGSPTEASSLMKSADNATVYLISGDTKYPIQRSDVLAALAPLGGVATVSAQYLSSLTTGHLVGRSIRGPDGTIYFFDSGMKLPFTSCQQAADYGASCANDGYVQLNAIQIAAFVTGPALTPVLGTTAGARYYVTGGVKREILDAAAQAAAGIPAPINVLSEGAISHLPLGDPIVRDSVYVLARGTSTFSFISGTTSHPIAIGSETGLGVSTRTSGSLWPASLARMIAGPTFAGLVTADGTTSLLSADAAFTVTAGGLTGVAPVTVAPALVQTYRVGGQIAPGSFLKSPTRADVYIVMAGQVRAVGSWSALETLTPPGQPVVITTVTQTIIDAFPKGAVALTSGTLVRTSSDPTVYLINGVTNRIPLSSFVFPVEAGYGQFSFESDDRIHGYPVSSQLMTFGIACGDARYVAAGGQVHLIAPELVAAYPLEYVALDSFMCARLRLGTPATDFIRTSDGSIYQLVAGQKRPISTMARFGALSEGGKRTWLNVTNELAQAIPTGPPA